MRSTYAPRTGRRTGWRRSSVDFSGVTVLVDGEGIHYRMAGSAEAQGHTVICLHGMGGSSRCWEDLLPPLGASAYVVAVDLPGHGGSEGNGAPRVQPYRHFLSRFLATMGVRQRVVLFGHCMGAAIALDFAAHHPDQVAGLVLAGVGPRLHVAQDVLEAARCGEFPDRFVGSLLAPDCSPVAAGKVVNGWLTTRPEVRYLDLLATCQFDFASAADQVNIPTMLLVGTQDGIAPMEATLRMAEGLPWTTAQVLPGTAHMPMLEQPFSVTEAVIQFLASVRPARPVPLQTW